LLYNGYRVRGQWWRKAAWEALRPQLADWLVSLLENLRHLIEGADQLLLKVTAQIESQAAPQPKGVGLLTSQTLQREVFDWHRFDNRRQVASLTGLCPSVRASGLKSLHGAITKHGNPRLRRALIELAWRMTRFQPLYRPIVRWGPMLAQKQNRGGRKKAIVAVARQLAIDLWRLHTGRCCAADLHLV
jgi:transposase